MAELGASSRGGTKEGKLEEAYAKSEFWEVKGGEGGGVLSPE